MRILPRFRVPRFRQLTRRLRQLRHAMTVERTVLLFELIFYIGVFIYGFTGRRAAWIDGFGRRADLVALIVLGVFAAGVHSFVNRWTKHQI